ncbi:MAG: restriction endonuclease subunit S [Eubacteriales bacterium]|nr:restriction endonuclease subunit S [Eubacteriales bacterium]
MTRKLGEMGTFIKGAPLSKADISDEGTPFILYGELYTTYSEVTNSVKRKTDKTVEHQFYSKIGDVIMPTSGETPEDIATASCIMIPDVILAGDLLIYRTEQIDGRFVSFCVKNKVNKQISSVAQGKSVVHVRAEELSKISVTFPALDEQQKILSLLESIDRRIATQQKLIETLKKYKRGLLQVMFPQKGATVPKLRLAGFAGAWEQRKLGEILKTLPFKVYLKVPEQGGKFEIIQQGNDPIIGFANGEPCNEFRDIVIFGDHTLSLYKPKRPFFVATDGVRILQGVNEMDGNYLLSLLEKNKPISEGYKRYYSILADREVFFTNNRDEQKQIGALFENLDNLIIFHQSKLVLLRKQKNGLLQQLFI